MINTMMYLCSSQFRNSSVLFICFFFALFNLLLLNFLSDGKHFFLLLMIMQSYDGDLENEYLNLLGAIIEIIFLGAIIAIGNTWKRRGTMHIYFKIKILCNIYKNIFCILCIFFILLGAINLLFRFFLVNIFYKLKIYII